MTSQQGCMATVKNKRGWRQKNLCLLVIGVNDRRVQLFQGCKCLRKRFNRCRAIMRLLCCAAHDTMSLGVIRLLAWVCSSFPFHWDFVSNRQMWDLINYQKNNNTSKHKYYVQTNKICMCSNFRKNVWTFSCKVQPRPLFKRRHTSSKQWLLI